MSVYFKYNFLVAGSAASVPVTVYIITALIPDVPPVTVSPT